MRAIIFWPPNLLLPLANVILCLWHCDRLRPPQNTFVFLTPTEKGLIIALWAKANMTTSWKSIWPLETLAVVSSSQKQMTIVSWLRICCTSIHCSMVSVVCKVYGVWPAAVVAAAAGTLWQALGPTCICRPYDVRLFHFSPSILSTIEDKIKLIVVVLSSGQSKCSLCRIRLSCFHFLAIRGRGASTP